MRSRRTCASNLEFKSRELSFLVKLFSPRHTMAHFHMLRAYLLFRGIYDLFCHGLNWFRKCFERAAPNSDALNFLFLFPPIYRPVADENLWKMWSFSRKQLNEVYPSINHWWSITFATLPSIERAQPILLNTRTRYTVATNWYTFTHIYIWSSTSREMPESIIQCMIQQEVCSCDYLIDKLISYYTDSVKE